MSRTVPQPNEIPVKSYPTPSWGTVIDELLVDRVEVNQPGYVKLRPGAYHPNTRDFPNHRLLKEDFSGAYGINIRYWVNGYRNEDQHNYDINYSAESTYHPIFSRRYQIRRDEFSASTKAQAFSGIYLIKVTGAGSGYNPDIPPTVTISGGGGSGATATAIVGEDGTIAWVYLTNEGTGYTSTPTVSFSSGAATAVALTQLSYSVVSSVTITSAGSSYETAPTVTFSGGGGSGATAVAQVSSTGTVVGIVMTDYGQGYTSNPTVTFSGGGGSGAAGTAARETVAPYLVKEDVQQFPQDDPRHSLYLLVIRSYETLPGPVLVEHVFEPFINNYVKVQKRIVLRSQVPADMSYVPRVAGQITEYQPLSQYRSIQIISSINTDLAWENGGDDVTVKGTANFSFPDELTAADGSQPISTLSWLFVWAASGDNLSLDFDVPFNIKEGYSGPCEAEFITRYTFDPEAVAFQNDLPEVTKINPQAHRVWTYAWYSGGNQFAQIKTVNFPSTLHPAITLNIGGLGVPSDTDYSLLQTLPATVPTGLPSDTQIIASVRPEEWRFGLWKYTIVRITVP